MLERMNFREDVATAIFYIFVTVLLGSFGVSAVSQFGQQGDWFWASATVLLFAFHISLHWMTIKEYDSVRWNFFYYATQTILITLLLFVPYPNSSFGLNFIGSAVISMMAEGLALWGNTRRSFWLLLGYLIFISSVYLLMLDFGAASQYLRGMAATATFILLVVAMFNRQTEERERAESLAASMEDANEKLAAYANQVEELTLTAERQRMARDLHDTLAQGVAGLVLQLEAVKAHLANDKTVRSAEIVDQALAQARSTLADSRAAIDDLRTLPDNLEEGVRAKIERFRQATGISCDLTLNLKNQQMSVETRDHLLSILSEALSNVTRHAQATNVAVNFQVDGSNLTLTVQDDGRGFDPNGVTRNGHYGLLGMRERARLINGRLKIESEGDTGTRINLHVPLSIEGEPT